MPNFLLVLASSSPYRRRQLEQLRLPFETVFPNVDESSLSGELAREKAYRLSEMKAKFVIDRYPNALIIGSDQTAEVEGIVLEKPESHENAINQLRSIRNRTVTFYSGISLLNAKSQRAETEVVETQVEFANPTDEEIERYLQIEKPYDCTGATKIDGLGIALVRRIVGVDPSALIGLPLITIIKFLKNENINVI